MKSSQKDRVFLKHLWGGPRMVIKTPKNVIINFQKWSLKIPKIVIKTPKIVIKFFRSKYLQIFGKNHNPEKRHYLPQKSSFKTTKIVI